MSLIDEPDDGDWTLSLLYDRDSPMDAAAQADLCVAAATALIPDFCIERFELDVERQRGERAEDFTIEVRTERARQNDVAEYGPALDEDDQSMVTVPTIDRRTMADVAQRAVRHGPGLALSSCTIEAVVDELDCPIEIHLWQFAELAMDIHIPVQFAESVEPRLHEIAERLAALGWVTDPLLGD